MLDGRTRNGTVGLAPGNVEPFTGARWLAHSFDLPNNIFFLQCLGDVDGPRWLDGSTDDGTVGLAPDQNAVTGTRWEIIDAGSDEVNLRCLGESSQGKNLRFLRGTIQGTVDLVEQTVFDGHRVEGTRWQIVDAQPEPKGASADGSQAVTSATSEHSPSLVFVPLRGIPGNGLLHMAWRAKDDGRISLMRGVRSGGTQTVSLANQCLDRPALTLHTDGKLYLAWTGTDRSINVMSSSEGLVFSGKITLPGTSLLGPAITSVGDSPNPANRNKLVVAWVDADTGALKMMNGLSTDNRDVFTSQETSSAAPALAWESFIDGTDALIVAWTGTNAERQLNVMNSPHGFPPDSKTTLPTDGPEAATSISGPSLCLALTEERESRLVMGWTGLSGGPDHDNHLNIIFTNEFSLFHGRRTVAPVSGAGLAIANVSLDSTLVESILFGAWVDRQFQINTALYDKLTIIPA